jgi:hypothetical protein
MHTTMRTEDPDLTTTDTAMAMEEAEEEGPAVVEDVEDVGASQFLRSNPNSERLNGRNLVGLGAKFRLMVFITLCNHIHPVKVHTMGAPGPQALQVCQQTVRANFQRLH